MSKWAGLFLIFGTAWISGCAGPMFEGTIFEQPPRKSVATVPHESALQTSGSDVRQLTDQMDSLNRSIEVMSGRLDRLEALMKTSSTTPDDLVALRKDIQLLRSERETLKKEITDDLAARVEKIASRQQAEVRAARPSPAATVASSASAKSSDSAKRSGYEHKVEKGQTLSVIAKGYGTTVEAIMKANKIANPSSIRVGQVLFIPD